MINPKLGYSDKTQELIERMCRNVERKDFVLQKKKAKELILKTYDLFNLPRPKKVVWCVDIFDQKFQESARSAWSAGSAWSALDYDFDWFVVEHEYCENPNDDKPNENDHIYLEYCELLMQAKEAGLGYRVQWEDTLYLVPTPLVLIDEQNRFHSAQKPAIRWKGGKELYFLSGVAFDKRTWKKVVNPKVTLKTIFSLENMEQRMAGLRVVGVEKLLKGKKPIDKSKRGNELYLIKDVFDIDAYFLKYSCPSTGRVYVSGIDPEVGVNGDADECMAWKHNLTKAEYDQLEIES